MLDNLVFRICGPLNKQTKEEYRASGLCVCDICGKEYYYHSQDYFGDIFLNVLCNGDRVKL